MGILIIFPIQQNQMASQDRFIAYGKQKKECKINNIVIPVRCLILFSLVEIIPV